MSIPVFFSEETDELLQIYDAIQLGNSGDQAASAVEGTFVCCTNNTAR